MTLLQLGDYRRGFVEYEWRWQTGQFTLFRCPHPKWDGTPIPDQTLLIHTEQGSEDAIQFARYLPWAAERCKQLILVCSTELLSLFATIPGISQLREAGQIQVHEFDTYLPLLSLPHVFGTTREIIPVAVSSFDVAAIRRRKRSDTFPVLRSQSLKMGLVWAGSPTHQNDRHRSCALREFEPLLRTPGIAFYSLQKGKRSRELTALPPKIVVQDLEPYLHDFGDLAVIIEQLDLVISVDTVVVHLAGALGKPVWTLLPFVPDWRWGLEGERTPWYRTMRLFRQSQPGNWAAVMARVVQELVRWREQ